MEILGSFILNTNKFLTFSYKKKEITLQDTTSEPILVTLEDYKDISQVILQENKKSMRNMQKEIDKVIIDKNEEIYCLKNHSQNLIAQIKKLKGEKKSQQEMLKQLMNKKSLIDKETMIYPTEIKKSSAVQIQVVEKGTSTNPVEVKSTSDVGVQTLEIPSVLTNRGSSINNATSMHEEKKTPKENQENDTSTNQEILIDIQIIRAYILTNQIINITRDENN
jgi:hypothetical protein